MLVAGLGLVLDETLPDHRLKISCPPWGTRHRPGFALIGQVDWSPPGWWRGPAVGGYVGARIARRLRAGGCARSSTFGLSSCWLLYKALVDTKRPADASARRAAVVQLTRRSGSSVPPAVRRRGDREDSPCVRPCSARGRRRTRRRDDYHADHVHIRSRRPAAAAAGGTSFPSRYTA